MSEVIRLLPDHIANQIAAGEVIQRPASVIKELVENALDAGASQIEIWVKDAGKTLMQVVDNGCGMSEIDARMAFERHATSKLSSADDLYALKTKGFRGEALASIAAIAHVSLTSRQETNEWGTTIMLEGSQVIEQNPATGKVGSSFAVKNLFYNVPARRNFLKSDSVELKHIEDEFQRIVLAHPEVKFSLVHNDQVLYHLETSNLRKRIVDVFGRLYNDRLVPISEKTGIVEIEGFIGKPEFAKKTRGEQFFFVNDRFFKDSYFNHAINQAYDNLLTPKTYPSYFIFFRINPAAIDVNVHPTKTEIKFEDDREIYAILKSAVRQSLGQFNLSPSLDFEQETGFDLPWEMRERPAIEPEIKVNPDYNPFQSSSGTASGKSVGNGHSGAIRNEGFGNIPAQKTDWDAFYKLDELPDESEMAQQEEIVFDSLQEAKKAYIFQGPFIICPIKTGLLFVHARRAKERVLYDQLMQAFIAHPIDSQQLLFPAEVEMSASLLAAWQEHAKIIERIGFCWENKTDKLEFTGVPTILNAEQVTLCIQSISEKLIQDNLDKGELAHEFMLSLAKASTQQTYRWDQESADHLIEQLFLCPEHQYSPAGKLILKKISTEELLSQF